MADTPQQPQPDPSYRAALEKTASAEDFSAEGVKRELEQTPSEQDLEQTPGQFLQKTATDRTRTSTADRTSTVTSFEEASEVLPDFAAAGEEQAGKRFEVVGQVGSGATSKVYAVRDKSLSRTVAVKFLRHSRNPRQTVRQRFLHEARVTAMLEHPNIMPVHDIGVTPKGEVYFTMKNIGGSSLGDAIRSVALGQQVQGDFATIDGRVRIFLKVCDALAYAHSKGFIHQDIKPDNIMLGEYGEVLVLDWGSALAKVEMEGVGQRGLYGTPAYMSPEQARREQADERSDVYCLGATLFQALLLRHPTWSEDAEVFWEKKRKGVVDEPTEQERRQVPRQLLAIVLRSLASEPSQRYQGVGELATELKRWQAGRAVAAYRESLVETFVRWYRRNKRLFWVSAAAALLVAGATGLFLREKVQELITWRHLFSDDFSSYRNSEQLAANWRCLISANWWDISEQPVSDTSAWHLKAGAAEGVFGFGFADLTFARQVPGDMRVEWTVTPVRMSINTNCYIAGGDRKSGYTFHVGGFGDPGNVALTRMENFQPLVRAKLQPPLEAGRACRLRMEKEGRHVRFFQNGRKLIDYVDMDELSGQGHQTFGFEDCQDNTIRIDNVAVYYHPLPRKVSPLAAADRFFQKGYFADAAGQFGEVIEFYPGSDLAAAALYRKALCLARLDSTAAALSLLASFERQFPRHELVPAAVYERSRLLDAQGDTAASHETLRRLARRFPGHPVLAAALNDMTARRLPQLRETLAGWDYSHAPPANQLAWVEQESRDLQQWGRLFGVALGDNELLKLACSELSNCGAYSVERVAAAFPEQRAMVCQLLLDRAGDPERVLRDYPDQLPARCRALYEQGRYAEALRNSATNRTYAARALLQLGRYAEVARFYPDQIDWCPPALVALGRTDQAIAEYPAQCGDLSARLGKAAELLPMLRNRPTDLCGFLTAHGRADSALAVIRGAPLVKDLVYLLPYQQALVGAGRFAEAADSFAWFNGIVYPRCEAYCKDGRPRDVLARFPDRPDVQSIAYGELGLFDSALAASAADRTQHRRALWRTDQREQMLARWPQRQSLAALVRLTQGRYEEVLSRYPEQRRPAALALYYLGRYEEALSRFGDQHDLAALSLLALGREPEALQRYPECRPEYADWLIARGRLDDVVRMFPDQVYQYCQALALLGRVRDAPRHTGPVRPSLQQACEIRALAALQAFRSGRTRAADSLLAALEREPFDYLWWPQRFPRFLLQPALHALAGDSARARRECEAMAAAQRERFSQRLSFEAQLLAGRTDTAQFLSQPYRYLARERLVLMQAVMDDAAGNVAQALSRYRAVLADQRCAQPRYQMVTLLPDALNDFEIGSLLAVDDVFASPTLREFVRWRVEELGGQGAR